MSEDRSGGRGGRRPARKPAQSGGQRARRDADDFRDRRGTRDRRGRIEESGGGAQRSPGTRPEAARPRAEGTRREEPPLPDDVTAAELDRSVRAELASLAAMNADVVARHLVVAGRLLEEDPELAYRHAMAAAKRAGRVGAVREAAGIAAYRSGRYAEALSELRAARRISGDVSLLPVMADCERGLGRPERAIEIAAGPEARRLDPAGRAELAIVVSGARRDMGQPAAALVALQELGLRPQSDRRTPPWAARVYYAYADALVDAGRTDEAQTWFGHAAAADQHHETDADLRLAELSGVTFVTDDGAWPTAPGS